MISVVIPTYKESDYLDLCLQSAIENQNDNGFYSSTNFTDALFNGDEYTIDIIADEFYFTGEKGEYGEEYNVDSLAVIFSKVSEEYYWYETSYQSFLSSRYSFAQPVQVYSNVENGHGIFAGYSTTRQIIDLTN